MLIPLILTSVVAAAGLECPLKQKNVSCSDQIPHLNLQPEDCIVEYFLRKNSTACQQADLRGDAWSRRLGEVRLRPYVWRDEVAAYTAFNISLLHARWTRLTFRLSAVDGAAPALHFCRAFHLSPRALEPEPAPLLYYDCLWCDRECEGRPFSLEYAASDGRRTEHGRFLFTVPPHSFIRGSPERAPPFPYVETSSLPTARVRWAPPPPGVATLRLRTLVAGSPQRAADVAASRGELSVALSGAAATSGAEVVFGLRAVLSDGSAGPEAKTPALYYTHKVTHGAYVWAGVATATAVIALLALALFLRKRRRFPVTKVPTTVVLVYEHASEQHLAVVRALAAYLRSAGGLEVLLDEEHIPLSAMDPVSWYQEALLRADVALLVSSPEPPPAQPPPPASAGLYAAAALAAQQLVAPRLGAGGRCLALRLPGRPRLLPAAHGLQLLRADGPSCLQRLARQLRGPTGGRGLGGGAHSALAKHVLQLSAAPEAAVAQVQPVENAAESSRLLAPRTVTEKPDLGPAELPWARPLPPETDDVDSLWDLQQMELLGGVEGGGAVWRSSVDADSISLDL